MRFGRNHAVPKSKWLYLLATEILFSFALIISLNHGPFGRGSSDTVKYEHWVSVRVEVNYMCKYSG